MDSAQADYARAQQLYSEGVIPKQALDAAHTRLVLAQKALEAAQQQLNIAKQGARDEKKRLAQAGVQAAQAALAQTATQLSFADLKAPFDGSITMRGIEAGQVISAGLPVVELADLSMLEILTQVPEALFADIKLEQAATVTFPALPQLSLSASVAERRRRQIQPRARFPASSRWPHRRPLYCQGWWRWCGFSRPKHPAACAFRDAA